MSNVIKKIKIKQQDGTFTDYIPIGAEAENVNVDGESVEEKLNKIPYYYNSVADMKADENLKVGDMAITLGYYEPNDGGKAEYKIVSAVDSTMWQEILNNELYATIQLNDKEIYAEQIGIKAGTDSANTDSTPLLQELFSLGYFKVIFGKGNYYFSECLIAGGSGGPNVRGARVFIQGQTLNHQRFTTFKPYNENQRFIFKFGGNADFSYTEGSRSQIGTWGIRIEGISFNDSNHPISSQDAEHPLQCGLLCIDQVYAFNSNYLDFYGCYGQCCYVRDSWELYFDCVNARDLLNMNSDYSIFYFASNTNTASNNNNTNFVCRHLDTEGVRCHLYSAAGNFGNHYIGTIIIESAGGDTIFDIENDYPSIISSIRNDYVKNPFIYLRPGSSGNLTIGTINTDHFCDGFTEINGVKYMMSTLKTERSRCVCNIKEINTQRRSLLFFESDLSSASDDYGKFNFTHISIDNIIFVSNYTGDSKYVGNSYFINQIGTSYNHGSAYIKVYHSNGIENPDLPQILNNGYYLEEDLFKMFFPITTICTKSSDARYNTSASQCFLKLGSTTKDVSKKFSVFDTEKITIVGKSGYKSTAPAAGANLILQFYDNTNTLIDTLTPTSHSRTSQTAFKEEFDLTLLNSAYSYFKIIPNTDGVTSCISYIKCE